MEFSCLHAYSIQYSIVLEASVQCVCTSGIDVIGKCRRIVCVGVKTEKMVRVEGELLILFLAD